MDKKDKRNRINRLFEDYDCIDDLYLGLGFISGIFITSLFFIMYLIGGVNL